MGREPVPAIATAFYRWKASEADRRPRLRHFRSALTGRCPACGCPPRQLLFRAGDVDVDVKIESMEANDRITLVGQVLSTTAKFFDNTPVKLESHGIVRYRTMTNLVGEFSFDEVPKDTYHLSVDLPKDRSRFSASIAVIPDLRSSIEPGLALDVEALRNKRKQSESTKSRAVSGLAGADSGCSPAAGLHLE
jgi:hypothetical protein